jgi:hypothetical protein
MYLDAHISCCFVASTRQYLDLWLEIGPDVLHGYLKDVFTSLTVTIWMLVDLPTRLVGSCSDLASLAQWLSILSQNLTSLCYGIASILQKQWIVRKTYEEILPMHSNRKVAESHGYIRHD